ncbi:phosphatase [Puteibacter caeruleilacunae]|nr:phosphatase [Puteibacter caeruleilacunae]
MRRAIIDLGTNTCNLGIAEYSNNGTLEMIVSEREPVKLAAGGITRNVLTTEAMERGLKAIQKHKNTIGSYADVSSVKIFATSAVRNAINQQEFVDILQTETGVDVEVIDGNREAELIFKGVMQAVPAAEDTFLILDIGGGSNEFILVQNGEIKWKRSFEIGIARVAELFDPKLPSDYMEIQEIEKYFFRSLEELWQTLENYEVNTLVGCAGAFDAFADLVDNIPPETTYRKNSALNLLDYARIHMKLMEQADDIMELMKDTDPVRKKMIAYASIFVNFILKNTKIKTIMQTGYSLKEGALSEYINQ